jgi:hypothetical protein
MAERPLLAQSGHELGRRTSPLMGVKRTLSGPRARACNCTDWFVCSAGQVIDVSILCSRFRIARIQGVNALLPHAT